MKQYVIYDETAKSWIALDENNNLIYVKLIYDAFKFNSIDSAKLFKHQYKQNEYNVWELLLTELVATPISWSKTKRD